MQRCLHEQIGRNVDTYVDDNAVISREKGTLLDDLRETFANLRRYKMKLNPLKCVFGVPSGQLLGFIVSQRGIEVNPEKIKAILDIKRPTCLKDVQRLTGSAAAVSRFISRLGDKALPLYKLLKKPDKFVWTEEADNALTQLKKALTEAPTLASPREDEPMLLYLAATNRVISASVVVERKKAGQDIPDQHPVYYISEVFSESKQRYPHYQKLAYGVFFASRKLRHYFQGHSITVVSKAPLGDIINNADATGHVAKWGIELATFDIKYQPRTAIKSQALVDFVADWTEAMEKTPLPESEYWIMHFDGSKMKEGSGAGVVPRSPKRDTMSYVLQIHFNATNNVAEYEALLHGLHIAKDIGVSRILCYGDSALVQHQLNQTWDAKSPIMAEYRRTVDEFTICFQGFEVKHINRHDNWAADALAWMGSERVRTLPPGVFVQHLFKPSIQGGDVDYPLVSESVAVLFATPDWTVPYLKFLVNQEYPEGADEVQKWQLVRRCKGYTVIKGTLYKRSTSGIFQRCITPEEGWLILKEIHAGDCGHHAQAKSLVAKTFRQGFFWLTAKEDAERIVKHCAGCQYFAKQSKLPAQALRTIPITWPFAVWGLDMVGSFKTGRGGLTHLLVAVDKYTKWVEAKLIKKLDGAIAKKLMWEIVSRFGVPNNNMIDNGTNFAQGELAK